MPICSLLQRTSDAETEQSLVYTSVLHHHKVVLRVAHREGAILHYGHLQQGFLRVEVVVVRKGVLVIQ